MYQDCVELKSLSAHRANTGAAGSSPWRGALARLVRLRRLAASSRGPVGRRPGPRPAAARRRRHPHLTSC